MGQVVNFSAYDVVRDISAHRKEVWGEDLEGFLQTPRTMHDSTVITNENDVTYRIQRIYFVRVVNPNGPYIVSIANDALGRPMTVVNRETREAFPGNLEFRISKDDLALVKRVDTFVSGSAQTWRSTYSATQEIQLAVQASEMEMKFLSGDGTPKYHKGEISYTTLLTAALVSVIRVGVTNLIPLWEKVPPLDPNTTEKQGVVTYQSRQIRLKEGFRAPLALLVQEVVPPQKYN